MPLFDFDTKLSPNGSPDIGHTRRRDAKLGRVGAMPDAGNGGAGVSVTTSKLLARAVSSRWFAVAARGVMLALGLLVLAAIGRSAARRASAIATAVSVDAGELRATLPAEIPDASASAPVTWPSSPPVPPSSAPASTSTPARASPRATPEDPVYVNYASAEELRRLPGVGAKRAEAIVALRARMGRFQRVEDLMRVKGIGRATIKKLRPLIRLDQPRAPDAGAAP